MMLKSWKVCEWDLAGRKTDKQTEEARDKVRCGPGTDLMGF